MFVLHVMMVTQDHVLPVKLVVTLLMAPVLFAIPLVLLVMVLVPENALPARMAQLLILENVSLVLMKAVLNVTLLVLNNVLPVKMVLTFLLENARLVMTKAAVNVVELANVLLVKLAIWTPMFALNVRMKIVLPVAQVAPAFVLLVMMAILLKLDSVLLARTPIVRNVLELQKKLAQAALPTTSWTLRLVLLVMKANTLLLAQLLAQVYFFI